MRVDMLLTSAARVMLPAAFPCMFGVAFPLPRQRLVCHDAGQCVYKQDAAWGAMWGSGADSPHRHYTPLFWADVDVFVYFSHGFVTLPPSGWVAAAHTNGVPILGTVIMEWEVNPACLSRTHIPRSSHRAARSTALCRSCVEAVLKLG